MLAGAYQPRGVEAGERPRYGGLNLAHHLNGACPRFGSSRLRQNQGAHERMSVSFGDSSDETVVGVPADDIAGALASLLEAAALEARLHPELWRVWGSDEEIAMQLKDVWLMLVALGAPASR